MENAQHKFVTIPGAELWDEETETFLTIESSVLELEHSLATISKWEAKTHLPFFSNEQKTPEQFIEYIKCMTVNDVPDNVYANLTVDALKEINEFIEDKMTATWFNDKRRKGGPKRVITSELVYCWMVTLNIPFECEHWHFNRLMTLINVCNEENKPRDKKKRFTKDDAVTRSALNKQRQAMMKTKG